MAVGHGQELEWLVVFPIFFSCMLELVLSINEILVDRYHRGRNRTGEIP